MNRPTCNARTGQAAGEYGFQTLWCNTTIGLRSFRDRLGETRRYCGATGHREAVVARYGEYEPEQADPITAAKARDDILDGVAHFDWHGHDIEVEVA